MNQAKSQVDGLPDPITTPLEELDVADPRRFEYDTWQPLFERLRRESPIHYQGYGPGGAGSDGDFWSITRFNDIMEVEKNWEVFSSSPSTSILDPAPDFDVQMFVPLIRQFTMISGELFRVRWRQGTYRNLKRSSDSGPRIPLMPYRSVRPLTGLKEFRST